MTSVTLRTRLALGGACSWRQDTNIVHLLGKPKVPDVGATKCFATNI